MEHRCGARYPARLAVMLLTVEGRRIPGMLRDVSVSGVFVETSGYRWQVFTTVELRQVDRMPEGYSVKPVVAMVIRTAANGIGLMFDSLQPSFKEECMSYPGPARQAFGLPITRRKRQQYIQTCSALPAKLPNCPGVGSGLVR